jgi:hypothetical protein
MASGAAQPWKRALLRSFSRQATPRFGAAVTSEDAEGDDVTSRRTSVLSDVTH